ncbi:MAG: hypothetical protein HC910_21930 [Spirulinaceae cyanobacterium SM2_1_0]|nr:hypothetical protein [Spirulinaceae cyanobacterium SM2_1_0]
MNREIRRLLKQQEKALVRFAEQLRDGKVSEKQALARIRNYGRSPEQAWHQLEHAKRPKEENWQAKRWLDPQAKHCPDCLRLHTKGQWRAVNLVKPPGQACRCRTRCRCQIAYRRFVNGNILDQVTLAR